MLRSPHGDERAWGGGITDILRMQKLYPAAGRDFNVFYVASAAVPLVPDVLDILPIVRRRGAPFVLNQDGIGRPGWAGFAADNAEVRDDTLARTLIHEADYVFFQSDFCRKTADRFVGPRAGPWEVLHNAVDTDRFGPTGAPRTGGGLVLMLGGNQVQPDRLATALRVLAYVAEERPDVRLIVTGIVGFPENDLMQELGVEDRVEFTGTYPLSSAPGLYRRADILVHTRVNDPCPNTVLEAMASGLPVVHPISGGTPELVAGEAGIGVPVEHSWERDILPDPAAMARAVLEIAPDLEEWSAAARRRAVTAFGEGHWFDRHRDVIGSLVS
jgi:glycosyltransferase involved in cell wall biosynthesis